MHHSAATASEPDISNRREAAGRVLLRCREGDVDAFAELYDLTAGALLACVRRIVGPAWAEDVLSEAYLQVWRTLHTFDPARGGVWPWLHAIARSRALDHLRREGARGASLCTEWKDEHAPIDRDTPETAAVRKEESALLQASLLRLLTPRERLVLGLAYFREYSLGDIAGMTGLPLGTVKTLVRRSHRKLRADLAPGLPVPSGP